MEIENNVVTRSNSGLKERGIACVVISFICLVCKHRLPRIKHYNIWPNSQSRVVYHLHGQTRFGRMVSKISSGNHVYDICKSVSDIVKRPRRLETGIKDGYVWNSPSGNTGLPFLIFRCFWKFSAGTTQKVVLNLLSNRTFWNYL